MEELLDNPSYKEKERKTIRKIIGRGILYQSIITGALFYAGSLWMYFNLKESKFLDLFEIVFIIGGGFHLIFTGLLFLQYLIQKPQFFKSVRIQFLLFMIPLIVPIVPMFLASLNGAKNRTDFAFFVMPIYYLPVVVIAFLLFRRKLKQSF